MILVNSYSAVLITKKVKMSLFEQHLLGEEKKSTTKSYYVTNIYLPSIKENRTHRGVSRVIIFPAIVVVKQFVVVTNKNNVTRPIISHGTQETSAKYGHSFVRRSTNHQSSTFVLLDGFHYITADHRY
jgi:hypothetical protein